MKGQIAFIEAILASIVLFVAFNIMITTGDYQTKWKESLNSLQGKDVLITVDRLGKIYDYSFSPSFETFLNTLDSIKDSIKKVEIQGAIKNTVYVACACTSDQITYLENIFNGVKFNTRSISVSICETTLPTINTCGASTKYPNALVIWGYTDLNSYTDTLLDFVNDGNGLIEIADILNSKVDGGGDDDNAQKRIFGLQSTHSDSFPDILTNDFLRPGSTSQLPYQSYKWFHHLPYNLIAGNVVSQQLPVDRSLQQPGCPAVRQGEFKFHAINHKFWICNHPVNPSVYFDTDGSNKADLGPITKGQTFSITTPNPARTSKFKLNYIESPDKIRVSFKPDYKFNDFIVKDNNHNKLDFPIEDYRDHVLLSMGFWDDARKQPIAGIIFNGTENGKTVWMADFARSATTLQQLNDLGDDYKQLLSPLILSMSNKKIKETFQQVGQITSYINVNNTDILEIYKIELSIGKPF